MTKVQDKKMPREKILVMILSIITLLSIGVTVWAVFLRQSEEPVMAPDYAPQETEQNAQPTEEDAARMEAPSGGGAVSLTYAKEVSIDLSDKKASLLFANPGKSTQDMVLQLIIQDAVVIQSGKLTPGNQVTTLDLLKDAEKLLTAGGYEGKFVVLYYNQQSGEKAMINTEIPVTITVTE